MVPAVDSHRLTVRITHTTRSNEESMRSRRFDCFRGPMSRLYNNAAINDELRRVERRNQFGTSPHDHSCAICPWMELQTIKFIIDDVVVESFLISST